jgi:hypothetical protein
VTWLRASTPRLRPVVRGNMNGKGWRMDDQGWKTGMDDGCGRTARFRVRDLDERTGLKNGPFSPLLPVDRFAETTASKLTCIPTAKTGQHRIPCRPTLPFPTLTRSAALLLASTAPHPHPHPQMSPIPHHRPDVSSASGHTPDAALCSSPSSAASSCNVLHG